MTSKDSLVKLQNVSLIIDQKPILSKVNLDLKNGKITTLIGPNGGGKTSIARILLGILKQNSGVVTRTPGIKIGYMPQKILIDKTIPMRVKDFLNLSTYQIKTNRFFSQLTERLAVTTLLNKQIHDLSGGQLQKVLFLRAVVTTPDLLVLDEPTQCMDIAAIQDFYKIIEEVKNHHQCTILLISHDLHMVMQKTDEVFCINHHVCCHGSPESVNRHPEYLSLFGSREPGVAVYRHHHNHEH